MLERDVKIGGIYKHFKGHIYEVICIGKDVDNLKDKVIYKNVHSGDVWVRDKEEFLSFVDKEKYPDVLQEYRFELVN